jgi:hypothetical protein
LLFRNQEAYQSQTISNQATIKPWTQLILILVGVLIMAAPFSTLLNSLGSGGFVLLDKSHFSGTNVEELGAVVGKSGKLYILNANNLGGYKEGVGQSDNVVQTLQLKAGVWGGCGSYPLEVDTYPRPPDGFCL